MDKHVNLTFKEAKPFNTTLTSLDLNYKVPQLRPQFGRLPETTQNFIKLRRLCRNVINSVDVFRQTSNPQSYQTINGPVGLSTQWPNGDVLLRTATRSITTPPPKQIASSFRVVSSLKKADYDRPPPVFPLTWRMVHVEVAWRNWTTGDTHQKMIKWKVPGLILAQFFSNKQVNQWN